MDKIDVYKAGQKTDAPTQAIETNGGEAVNENSLLWVLASIQHAKKIMLSQTAFNLIIRYKQSQLKDLLIISALAAMHEILCQAMQAKHHEVKTGSFAVVCDHVIYSKGLEIL